jgi:hypothetical protein
LDSRTTRNISRKKGALRLAVNFLVSIYKFGVTQPNARYFIFWKQQTDMAAK